MTKAMAIKLESIKEKKKTVNALFEAGLAMNNVFCKDGTEAEQFCVAMDFISNKYKELRKEYKEASLEFATEYAREELSLTDEESAKKVLELLGL